MKRMNLLVMIALGVTGMLYAGGGPAPLAPASELENVRSALGNLQVPAIDFRKELTDVFQGRETQLSDKDHATIYALTLYQQALRALDPANPQRGRALAALKLIVTDDAIVKQIENTRLFSTILSKLKEVLAAK